MSRRPAAIPVLAGRAEPAVEPGRHDSLLWPAAPLGARRAWATSKRAAASASDQPGAEVSAD